MATPFFDNVESSDLGIGIFLYTLFVFLIIVPPSELITAGFTIPNLFSYFFVENEETSFISYHIKRISLKYLTQSFLSLGYVTIFLYYGDWSVGFYSNLIRLLTEAPLLFRYTARICFLIPCLVGFIVMRWHLNDCYYHPIVRQLRLFITTNNVQNQTTWHNVESSINTEFRRFDKFTCGSPTSNVRCYVLDSWILKCSMYHVNIAQQSNVRVELVEAHDIHLQETNEQVSLATQYLNIVVRSLDPQVETFYIR